MHLFLNISKKKNCKEYSLYAKITFTVSLLNDLSAQ